MLSVCGVCVCVCLDAWWGDFQFSLDRYTECWEDRGEDGGVSPGESQDSIGLAVFCFVLQSIPGPNCNMYGDFPTPTSNSEMPAGCLRIQLNSDTIYPEIDFDSAGKGLSPTRPPFTSKVTSPSCYLCF